MRKVLATAAALGLAGLGVLVPATGAQASTACDNAYKRASSGYFYAYDDTNCSALLGRGPANDSNWGDSSGLFQSSDNDSASSILHKGSSGLAVKVYQGSGYSGGHICLTKSETYVSDLARHTFSDGASANNAISSHQWVRTSACDKFMASPGS